MESLAERNKTVLVAVIREYIKTAKAISSRHLLSTCSFSLSSATLRNTMASLEAGGYLTHPHTSAGRVPTAKGYRFYVNALSNKLSLGLVQRRYIIDFFSAPANADELLKRTSAFIAQITPYLGVVSRYHYRKLGLKHIDLVALENGKLLLVLITEGGEVFRERISVSKFDFNLQRLEMLLNKHLAGLELGEICTKCKYLSALGSFGSLFDEVSEKLIEMLESSQSVLYYDGLANLLNFPEFGRLKLLSSILAALKDSHEIHSKFSADADKDFNVAIGEELNDSDLKEVSLVAAPYYLNEVPAGSVAIMGPMRMDYEQMIATTECVAGNLTKAITK